MVTVLLQSSLEKVFLDSGAFAPAYERASALGGERFSFQLVLRRTERGTAPCKVWVESPFPGEISLFLVGQVPCQLPAYPNCGGGYLTTRPGLFPDPLFPLEEGEVPVSSFSPTAVWVEAAVPQGCPPGEYPLRCLAECQGERAWADFTLQVVGADLPEQKLRYTQWVHGDCLAQWYQTPVYGPAYWELLGRYLALAAQEGMNVVLTPALTPPLDTEVGKERLPTQLLDIEKEGETYRFGFSRLERFLAVARQAGMRYFEVGHLFTQWGAKAAPAVYALENGARRRIFGWDTPAAAGAYGAFLGQMLPALTRFFREQGLEGKVFFHLSDEPGEEHLDDYRRAKELVKPYLGDFPLYDALSDPAYYDSGLVDHPVAATDHIGPFLERKVPGLWAYYCCAQGVDVSNRFLAMPSCRNRILGWQLYKFQVEGFLHWGYNFWNTQLSRQAIDPYQVTDGGRGFPGGDPFSVYPGKEGPVPSLRQKVFCQGLQDLRALELLEARQGRQAAEECLPGFGELTFSRCPREAGSLLTGREEVNRRLAQGR